MAKGARLKKVEDVSDNQFRSMISNPNETMLNKYDFSLQFVCACEGCKAFVSGRDDKITGKVISSLLTTDICSYDHELGFLKIEFLSSI